MHSERIDYIKAAHSPPYAYGAWWVMTALIWLPLHVYINFILSNNNVNFLFKRFIANLMWSPLLVLFINHRWQMLWNYICKRWKLPNPTWYCQSFKNIPGSRWWPWSTPQFNQWFFISWPSFPKYFHKLSVTTFLLMLVTSKTTNLNKWTYDSKNITSLTEVIVYIRWCIWTNS